MRDNYTIREQCGGLMRLCVWVVLGGWAGLCGPGLGGCQKFTQVPPPVNQLVTSLVFSNDISATEALTGIYGQMQRMPGLFGNYPDLSLEAGLYSDELRNCSSDPIQVQFNNDRLSNVIENLDTYCWSLPYSMIYQANAVLEGLAASKGVSAGVKQQLSGEAKFVRAFCYFHLVNLFGNIPLATGTDYRVNNVAMQARRSDIYSQMIGDLKEAEGLLNEQYVDSTDLGISMERIRPNKYAASALLARVYLYAGDWLDADTEASKVIGNEALYDLVRDKNKVFLKNSREAIWQLPAVGVSDISTFDGYYFIPVTTPGYAVLDSFLLKTFELGDTRRVSWVDSVLVGAAFEYYPYKYKMRVDPGYSEYTMVLRLAEQYLIRAEARAQEGDLIDAAQDVDTIRKRAGLGPVAVSNQADLLSAIYHERQVELFTEWGLRFFDLKRSGQAGQVLGAEKGGFWQAKDTLWPIPLSEIQNNPRLVQNPGY